MLRHRILYIASIDIVLLFVKKEIGKDKTGILFILPLTDNVENDILQNLRIRNYFGIS